jgi:hypothetical protein
MSYGMTVFKGEAKSEPFTVLDLGVGVDYEV